MRNEAATGRWLRQNGVIVVMLDSTLEPPTRLVSEIDWRSDSELGKPAQGTAPFESPCPAQGSLPASKAMWRDQSGCWYRVGPGDYLFKVARAGLERMLLPKGIKATKSDVTAYAQCVTGHPNNAPFRSGKPSSIFPDGSIKPAFLPLWSPADLTSRKRRGEKGSYPAIWLPRLGSRKNLCGPSVNDPSTPDIDPAKPKPGPKTEPSKPEPWDPSVLCNDLERPAFRKAWKEAICSLEFVVKRLDDIAAFSLPQRTAFWNHIEAPQRRWFGRYDAERFRTIRKIIGGALTALRSRDLLGYCTTMRKQPRCGKRAALAWRKTKVIQLCPTFFQTPDRPTTHDEKVVMLVHEAAHLAGAWIPIERYKLKNTQRLARYRPNAAARNAENYACYVAQVCRLKFDRCASASAGNSFASVCAGRMASS